MNLAFQALHPQSLHPHQFTSPVAGGKLKVSNTWGSISGLYGQLHAAASEEECPQSQ